MHVIICCIDNDVCNNWNVYKHRPCFTCLMFCWSSVSCFKLFVLWLLSSCVTMQTLRRETVTISERLTLVPAGIVKEIPTLTWKSPTYKKRCHVPDDSCAMGLCLGSWKWKKGKKKHNQAKNMQPVWMNESNEEEDEISSVLKAVFLFHAIPLSDWYNR